MLQGTERKIIFLKSTKSKHFDEAYFVLKDDIVNDNEHEILCEAERIIFTAEELKRKRQKRPVSFKGVFFLSLGTLLGSFISCVLCLIAH